MEKLVITLSSIALLFASCAESDEPVVANVEPQEAIQSHLRSKVDAITVAQRMLSTGSQSNDFTSLCRSTATASVDAYTDGALTEVVDSNSVYVVNFAEGGFALVAANPDVEMPLGFSDNGQFIVDEDPNGISQYILKASSGYLGNIVDLRDSLLKPIKPVPFPGNPVNYAIVAHQDHYCHKVPQDTVTSGSNTQYLLKTTWDQRNPYNYAYYAETNKDYPAGCVPVAIGQLMAYNRKPAVCEGETFNWGLILTQPSYNFISETGCKEVARLLYWIGKQTGVTYAETGSGTTSAKAVDLFRKMGYHNTNMMPYSYSTIVEQLKNNRPVYVKGDDTSHNEGHAWIIDGYYRFVVTYKYYRENTLAPCSTETESNDYVHCNWGWRGDKNGFFISGLFKVDVYNFTHDIQMIIDIY